MVKTERPSLKSKINKTKQQKTEAQNKRQRVLFRSNKTKIRPGALSEIGDIGTVYILGGNPTYIHSRTEYFKTGLNIATHAFNKMLDKMIQEQKSVMMQKAHNIDQMWKAKLQRAFGKSIPSFSDFQYWWERAIMNEENPSEFFSRLEPLLKLKEAKVRKNALDKMRSEIRESLNKKEYLTAEQKAAQMEDALAPYHMTVSVNTKQNTMSYSGLGKELEKEWERIIKENTKLALLNPNDNIDAEVLKSLSDARLKELTEGKNIKDTTIGNLFELRSVGIYKNIQNDLPGLEDRIISLIVENVAGEKTGQDTKKFKADSKIAIALDGEVVFDFFVSDKASQTVARGLKDMTEAPIIEQFVASLNSESLDFTKYGISSSALYADNSLMQRIFNYVFTNYAALNINIRDFKESVVLYAAWLKICSEIIGEVGLKSTPMAVRTLNTIYNTADLLRLFINLDTYDMFKYLRKSDLESGFFAKNYKLTPIQKQSIFIEKKLALLNMADDKETVNYQSLYNNSLLQNYLRSIGANIKRPALHTSFIIKLTNLKL